MSAPGPHLAFSQLVDLAEERSAADDVATAHLAACPLCAAELAWLRGTLDHLRAAPLETPPSSTTTQLKALFRHRRSVDHSVLIGRIEYDSARHAPAFGVRSATAWERQLVVMFPDMMIDLRLSPLADTWDITGQLVADDLQIPVDGRIELLGSTGSAATRLDDLGEFSLQALRSGTYKLTLTLPTHTLVVPHLELGT